MFYPSKCQGFAPEATDDYLGGLIHDLQLDTAGLKSFEQLHLFRKIEKRSGGIPKNEIGPRMCHSCVNSSPPELGNEITCSSLSICRPLVTLYIEAAAQMPLAQILLKMVPVKIT